MRDQNSSKGPATFWSSVRQLRADGKIPRQWRRKHIHPHLLQAGFAANTVWSVPFNQSISRDGTIKGNYVKQRRAQPMAYRVGRGLFELIDDPEGSAKQTVSPRQPAATLDGPCCSKPRLIAVIGKVALMKMAELNAMKKAAHWEAPDFIWEALLVSMATMGNSRGDVLVRDEKNHSRVRYNVLVGLTSSERRKALADALSSAKVRMAQRKVSWLCENFDRIRREGGPVAVKRELEACQGREAKIEFLREFRGIGDKYARNIMMDVYHAEFRETIAVDERIRRYRN